MDRMSECRVKVLSTGMKFWHSRRSWLAEQKHELGILQERAFSDARNFISEERFIIANNTDTIHKIMFLYINYIISAFSH